MTERHVVGLTRFSRASGHGREPQRWRISLGDEGEARLHVMHSAAYEGSSPSGVAYPQLIVSRASLPSTTSTE